MNPPLWEMRLEIENNDNKVIYQQKKLWKKVMEKTL